MTGLFEPEPFEQIPGQLSMETDPELEDWQRGGRLQHDDNGQPIIDTVTCEQCGRSWNDALITSRTPVPSGRCPFEDSHDNQGEDHCEACGAPDDGTQSYCEQCGEALIDPKYIPEDVQPPEPSPEPEPIPRKRWKHRSQGRYVVGRLMPDGRLDIYRGANTEAGAARARSEIRHWPEITTYDQATDTYR